METAIKITDLSVAYTKEDTLSRLSLNINKGEFVYIIGPNGGGKTTLIKSVVGILQPHSGKIEIADKNKIGYVPQKAETQRDFPITVLEALETAFLKKSLNPFRLFKEAEKQRAMEILKLLGIEHLADSQIDALSGGEFQRVLIGRALAREPEILILDEPCANTDPISSEKIHEILESENQKGVTVIVVSHDINHVLHSKTRTVFINKDILFDGIADESLLKL